MTVNREYARYRVGHLNLPREEASTADTAARVILAEAWLDLANETGQPGRKGRGEFEAQLRRWVSRLAVGTL